MMMEREGKEKGINQYSSGVSEEIREIEWPAFEKVVRTTGVVIGVIAGSSVVLLTVNAVLAQLSDWIFDGKGVRTSLGESPLEMRLVVSNTGVTNREERRRTAGPPVTCTCLVSGSNLPFSGRHGSNITVTWSRIG
ncbi:hypothetical protein Ancab_013335 [Ancistrocladus abbreviatus]